VKGPTERNRQELDSGEGEGRRESDQEEGGRVTYLSEEVQAVAVGRVLFETVVGQRSDEADRLVWEGAG
jgi:hypothetical protein